MCKRVIGKWVYIEKMVAHQIVPKDTRYFHASYMIGLFFVFLAANRGRTSDQKHDKENQICMKMAEK